MMVVSVLHLIKKIGSCRPPPDEARFFVSRQDNAWVQRQVVVYGTGAALWTTNHVEIRQPPDEIV